MQGRWTALARMLRYLPEGGTLARADRDRRHHVILWLLWLLWLHALALFAFALVTGNGVGHALVESAALLPWAVAEPSSRPVSTTTRMP
jgi:hypothetical protein